MSQKVNAAIVDFSLGNLFSVQQACLYAGMDAEITSNREQIMAADVVILPGVGAYGDAMGSLYRLGLIEPLKEIASSGKMLVGICLGFQLMMTESYEFGVHKGLDLIPGVVEKFKNPVYSKVDQGQAISQKLKVPQIGWNQVYFAGEDLKPDSPLHNIQDGEFMYFVHSYYVKPAVDEVRLTNSTYGNIEFCSSIIRDNIFACQFHPERSGPMGLEIYKNIAAIAQKT